MSPLQTALLPLCILFRGSPSCLREAEDDEGSFKRAKKDFDESISTPFEGISVDDDPDSASASASVATVRSADVGVGTGKGAGVSAAASAPVYKKKSAELMKQVDGVPEDGEKDSKKVYR
jgi:hypothetical protein